MINKLKLFIAALALTACVNPSVEDKYLTDLRSTDSVMLEHADDQELITAGRSVCSYLDEGHTLESLIVELVIQGAPAEESGSIIGASVKHFCPEHMQSVNNL